VYDYALKCPVPGSTKLKDAMKPIVACRSYLAEVIETVKPQRILALGSWAVVSLLGRSVDMESVRRGYGWVKGTTPVFMLHSPGSIQENKFLKRRYEADFEWALTVAVPKPSHVDGIVHVIMDEKDALFAEKMLADHDELLFDTETAGIVHNVDFTIICAGLAPVDELESDAWVWSDVALANPGAKAVLCRLLSTKRISGSNIKYDAVAAEQCLDIDIKHIDFDTQLVRKLAEPTCMGRLEYAAELVGMGGHKEEAQVALRKAVSGARLKNPRPDDKPQTHWCAQAIRNGTPGATPMTYAYGLLPDDVLWRYNARDVLASATATIHLRNRTRQTAPKELKLWEDLYRPAVRSFKRIERVGMLADRQAFEAFSMHLNVGLDDLRQKFKAYGPTFNPNAAKQVADILFNRLKLPKQGLSEKTGEPSTAKDTLQRLAGMHPFVDQMMEWRRLEKLDCTYAAGMIPHILSDGHIHPTFRLDGAESGRISSENPNGQNIPRSETIEGKMARDGFMVAPGRVMLSFDQSQIELRVAAGMSGDVEMIEIFKSGMDYHMRTAQMIAKVVWGIVEEQVGKFHRSYAKTVNFGLLYGKTDAGLAQQLGCSVDEAAKVRRAILGRFKKLAELIKRLLYQVQRYGFVEVPWFDGASHVRPLYEAGGHDHWKKQNAENSSINTPIQGRAAWYTIAAIPLIHAWIDASGVDAEIINTVHDSVMIDCSRGDADEVVENVCRIMEGFDCWGVPLVVDIDAGERWGSLRSMNKGETLVQAEVRWVAEHLIKEGQSSAN
jgi:DNA polymerase I-like protein with 3'-5' exonuclease and polymerase domains